VSDGHELSLLDFAASEYARRGWHMPDLHVRLFHWLDETRHEPVRVLEVFRGAGKSTVAAVYLAGRLRENPAHQILVQAADDPLACDLSRDTLAVMEGNALTTGMVRQVPAVKEWWTIEGFERGGARTPQLRARGILSRTTGSRADEIVNDDVEVAKNVESEPMRIKLRRKLGEQTHISKVGGSKLFIGTPHTYNSIYDETIAAGAAHLVIPLFAHQRRHEEARTRRYVIDGPVGADGVWVFAGIGQHARLLVEGMDYQRDGDAIVLREAPFMVLDVCTGNAWPERFDRKELQRRRRACKTLNEWDSQYQLQAKPVGNIRLDPALIVPYDVEPQVHIANGEARMLLGDTQIVSATLRLDPASGKPKSDVSALCLVLQDGAGRVYWHRAIGLYGELAEVDGAGAIHGGQVEQVCDLLQQFQLTRVDVETNGIGGHVPSILRGAIKRRGLPCSVREVASTGTKNKRILAAIEPPLRSGYLWAHVSVLDVIEHQMRDWNPAITDQPDDYLDAGAGAIAAEPVRIGKAVTTAEQRAARPGWQPAAGTFEVTVDYSESSFSGLRGEA
jgi:hypothetical protein